MNHAATIARLFPEARPFRDFNIYSDGRFENKTLPKEVTVEFLESEWPTTQAAIQAKQELRSNLLAAWDATFTAGEMAFLQPLYLAALAKLDAGDIAGLKELILTAPSISAELDAKRETLAALLPK